MKIFEKYFHYRHLKLNEKQSYHFVKERKRTQNKYWFQSLFKANLKKTKKRRPSVDIG